MISFRLKLSRMPAGFALETVGRGEPISMLRRAFLTSDDGVEMYAYLDSISDMFLNAPLAERGINPSLINSCLVNIIDGLNANVYLDFGVKAIAVAKKKILAGDVVLKCDVADIRSVTFAEFEMPTKGGLVYTFREGWRRGLYFDYSMMPDEPDRQLVDLPELLGQLHTMMFFRDIFRLEGDVLRDCYAAGWFPFIRLSGALISKLGAMVEAGKSIEPVEEELVDSIASQEVMKWAEFWRSRPIFASHSDVLDRAVSHFIDGDYVSAAHILAARIEGVLRHLHLGKGGRPRTPVLLDGLVDEVRNQVNGVTAFLPEAFRDYMKAFFYASFDLESGQVEISRNSMLHGVTPSTEFDRKRALQLLLIVDQIAFYV